MQYLQGHNNIKCNSVRNIVHRNVSQQMYKTKRYIGFIIVSILLGLCFTLSFHSYNKDGNNQGHKTLSISPTKAEKFENNYTEIDNQEFLTFIKEKWIIPPPPEGQQDPCDSSQHGQSTFVDTILQKKKNGFFIECGAGDGQFLSNSLFFERERKWTGLLIEPNPVYFKSIKEKNRNAYLVNSCLSVSNSSGKYDFELNGYLSGLKTKSGEDTVTVQCFPLLSILYAIGNPKVDYFSLDVEGAEIPILKTIPWGNVTIDVIGVEYRVIGKSTEILVAETVAKLNDLRMLFKDTGLYTEIGILPSKAGASKEEIDGGGLDVFFRRQNLKS